MHRHLMFLLASFLFAAVPVQAAEATGFKLFVGGGISGSGPNFYVSLTRKGELKIRRTSLPIVPPGKLTESQTTINLTPAEADKLISLAEATKDFSVGCEAVPDGTSAHLSLVTAAGQVERKCSSAASWPRGAKSRLFLRQLNSKVPKKFQIF